MIEIWSYRQKDGPESLLHMTKPSDRYGRLVVLEKAKPGKNWLARWVCLCDCGTRKTVFQASLRSGQTQSCGCLQRERTSVAAKKANTKHGDARGFRVAPEYRAWDAMIRRCHNKRNKSYSDYGGRGIRVCARWRHSYELFLSDLGRRPSNSHSIERMDNSKGYMPSNVRWATFKEQNRNKRGTVSITVDRVSRSLCDWADLLRVPQNRFRKRLSAGWSPKDIVGVTKANRWSRSS
jgi:hypothetical protein